MNHFPPNGCGFHDVYGNVYEWVEDHMNGFPGFKTNYLYDDMSTTYFDGRHNVMLVSQYITLAWYREGWFHGLLARKFINACEITLCIPKVPVP